MSGRAGPEPVRSASGFADARSASAAKPGCQPASIALALFLGALALLVLAVAAAVLLVATQAAHLGGDLTGGLGATARSATGAITRGAQSAAQAVQDAADPLHPPRYAIHQDPEFDQLRTVSAGEPLGDSRQYRFQVVAIEPRPDGATPDERVYAGVHRQLIVPRVTKVLGVTIRTDDQGQDYALYRGQEFAIGGRVYKVNWLSIEAKAVGIVRFRQADQAGGPLVFDAP